MNLKKIVNKFNEDYKMYFKEDVKNFYCPILYEDSPGELCKGHILNRKITGANRKIVPQRKDVDCFYGEIEQKAIKFLNYENRTLLDNGSKFLKEYPETSLDINGNFHPLKYLSKNIKIHIKEQKLPEFVYNNVKMYLEDKVVLENTNTAQIFLELNGKDYHSHITATAIKAAHLAMFWLLGYSYINSCAAATTAKILSKFYKENKGNKRKNTEGYFGLYKHIVKPTICQYDVLNNEILLASTNCSDIFSFVVPLVYGAQMKIAVFLPYHIGVDSYFKLENGELFNFNLFLIKFDYSQNLWKFNPYPHQIKWL